MSLRKNVNITIIGGAGLMGRRIGAEMILCGCQVTLYDRDMNALLQAWDETRAEISALHGRGLVNGDDLEDLNANVTKSTSLKSAVENADLIIESIIEDLAIKRSVIASVSSYCRTEAIIATNTMTCSVSGIAEDAKNPKKFIGLRFLYPVLLIEDVEITLALQTDIQTAERRVEVFHRISADLYDAKQQEGAHLRNQRLGRTKAKSKLLPSAPPLEQNEEQTATNEATTNVKDKGKNEDEEENLCVICLSDPKSMLCYPCGHLCMCMTCAAEFQKQTTLRCPVCRGTVNNIIRIFT
eukprot:gene10865-2940_t